MDNAKRTMVKARLGALPTIAARCESIWAVLKDKKSGWKFILLGLLVMAYVLSPLDLIPDPILILGWLDDLLALLVAALVIGHKAEAFYGAIRERKELEAKSRESRLEEASANQDRSTVDT